MLTMKKIFVLSCVVLLLQISVGIVRAQSTLRTDSNTVTTRVGNPPTIEYACLIPNGIITCGSKNVPVNGCGHCGIGYEAHMKNCTYPGIYYAMDIGGTDFQNVILPSVEGKSISWSFVDQTNATPNQAIQIYVGTDAASGEKYWIQLHHTAPGSGKSGTYASGETGAQICGNGCGMGHVHVEFAKVDTSGRNIWVDAPDYFCKQP